MNMILARRQMKREPRSRMRTWSMSGARGLAAALLILVVGVSVGCGGTGTAPTSASSGSGTTGIPTTDPVAGDRKPAAEFSGVTMSGEQVSLSGYAGRPLVLAFWASW